MLQIARNNSASLFIRLIDISWALAFERTPFPPLRNEKRSFDKMISTMYFAVQAILTVWQHHWSINNLNKYHIPTIESDEVIPFEKITGSWKRSSSENGYVCTLVVSLFRRAGIEEEHKYLNICVVILIGFWPPFLDGITLLLVSHHPASYNTNCRRLPLLPWFKTVRLIVDMSLWFGFFAQCLVAAVCRH